MNAVMESQKRSKESVEEGNKNFMGNVGGNVNWCSHYGEEYRVSLKKLKIELPYDSAIPLLGIYSEKTIIQKIHASKCLLQHFFNPGHGISQMLISRGVDKEDVVHIYNGILLIH